MPAPTYQATGTAGASTTTLSVAWPSHLTNDIAILMVESCGGEPATLSVAAGFAAVANSPQATGTTTNGTQITAFWCRATSNAMSSPTIADAGNHVFGMIVTFRGCVTTGNPWDVTAGGVKAAASTSGTTPGLTTTVNDCLVVNLIARDIAATTNQFSAEANTTLSGVTELTNSDIGSASSGNGGGFVAVAGVRNNAGVVAGTTFTVTSSINAYLDIALKGDTTAPTAGPPTIPTGRPLLREQWAVADGSSLAGLGWFIASQGATVSVGSGGLRVGLDGLTGGYAESGSAYLRTPNNSGYVRLPATDWEFVVDITVMNTTSENYVDISMSDDGGGAGIATNGYTLSLSPSTAAYAIQRRDVSAQTDMVGGSFTWVKNTTHRVLWVRRGNFLGTKVWTPTSSPMPATWTASVSDPRYRGPKYAVPLLGLLGGNVAGPSEVVFRNLMISTPLAQRRAGRP